MQQQSTKLACSLRTLLHLKEGIWSRVPAEEDKKQPSLYTVQKISGALCNKNTLSPWCIFRFNGHWVTTTRSHHTCPLCFKYILCCFASNFMCYTVLLTLKYNLCSSKQFLKRFAQDILRYKNKARICWAPAIKHARFNAAVKLLSCPFVQHSDTNGQLMVVPHDGVVHSKWNGSSVFEVSQVTGTLSSVVIGQVNEGSCYAQCVSSALLVGHHLSHGALC